MVRIQIVVPATRRAIARYSLPGARALAQAALLAAAVGVLGNQGACVIAKSYEMKAFGITTGMPIWEALPLCPEAVFIKRDFEWYEVLSRKMIDVTNRFSPAVEYYSIDEMFFDAAGIGLDRAKELQRAILDEVGVPVSVGLSTSKTLAKLASTSGKPFGCVAADEPEQIARLLDDRPVDKITGVARRSARRLEPYGIRTCADFARADRRLIRRLLTKRGEDLWWELNGVAVLPLATSAAARKNISRGGSLCGAVTDPDRLAAWIARNTERLVEGLDRHGVCCERLLLILTFKNDGVEQRRAALPAATLRAQEAAMTAWQGATAEPLPQPPPRVLAACGDADVVIPPANLERLAERWPGTRTELFAGGGHAFMAQEPARLAALIAGFAAG